MIKFVFNFENMNANLEIFTEKIDFFAQNGEFVKLILSNKRDKKSDLNKITIKPVEIKAGFRLSFVYSYNTKDITKNFEISESIEKTKTLLKEHFFNADLFSTNEILQLIINKKGVQKLKTTEPVFKTLPKLNHDKQKKKRIDTKNNIYLQKLEITTADGKLRKNKTDKFRQINKYLEIIENHLISFDSKPVRIVDMGSGKGYLTFALYDFLTNRLKIQAKITGVEFRKELVDFCNDISKQANFENLNFIEGTIENSNFNKINILIALHACDTATDDAIYKGVKSEAELIFVAPCCQKQIRKQINATNSMSSVLKHGILKERQAELLTDGIRALILEAYGYRTKVFEFIQTEHTPKNVMIVAQKTQKFETPNQQILKKIAEIKSMFGIEYHYLEKLFRS